MQGILIPELIQNVFRSFFLFRIFSDLVSYYLRSALNKLSLL